MNTMNPIKITLITLVAWITLTIVYALNFVEDVSEKPFEVIMSSFYLTPIVCVVAFVISLFVYRSWINSHKMLFSIFSLLLVAWGICILLYVKSLFL